MLKYLVLCGALINLCHGGEFFEVNGTNYFMSYPLLKNWYEAGRYCTFYGMHLIDINTEAENDIIASILKATKAKHNIATALVWTSGTDQGSEGCYYWETTGNPMLYTRWLQNQPDNASNNEHCIEIILPEANWNDRPCLTKSSFICQSKRGAAKCVNCESGRS